MNPEQARLIKKALIAVAATAVAVFVVAQVLEALRGPNAKVEDIMPNIGAEAVDEPLSTLELRYPLESAAGVLADLRALPQDTLIFLNFWATWCPPCRDELPSMLRLSETMADRRFAIVAISYDESWEDIAGFFQSFTGGMPPKERLTIMRDPVAGGGVPLREVFGTTLLPDTYVVLNGTVLARFVNTRDWMNPAIVEYFQRLAPKK